MSAYYNENDPFAAAWLVELMKDGLIADGWVDTRSIWDVQPADVKGFTQCHFFAGIGVWSLALRLAGWDDDRPVWTGSAPCQPFSAAGKGEGFADERHLWPAWFHLITHGKRHDIPVLGEQVAAKAGRAWFDLVSGDMEALDHACGALDTSAAGCGAPFIGQRLYWLASAHDARSQGHGRSGQFDAASGRQVALGHGAALGAPVGLAAPTSGEPRHRDIQSSGEHRQQPENSSDSDDGSVSVYSNGGRGYPGGLAASAGERLEGQKLQPRHSVEQLQKRILPSGRPIRAGASGDGYTVHPVDYWRDADWLLCRDPGGARFRPVEPGTFPLVDARSLRNRLGAVRGAGNALNVSQAATFCEIARDYLDGVPVA